jgi:hypothetical protein
MNSHQARGHELHEWPHCASNTIHEASTVSYCARIVFDLPLLVDRAGLPMSTCERPQYTSELQADLVRDEQRLTMSDVSAAHNSEGCRLDVNE